MQNGRRGASNKHSEAQATESTAMVREHDAAGRHVAQHGADLYEQGPSRARAPRGLLEPRDHRDLSNHPRSKGCDQDIQQGWSRVPHVGSVCQVVQEARTSRGNRFAATISLVLTLSLSIDLETRCATESRSHGRVRRGTPPSGRSVRATSSTELHARERGSRASGRAAGRLATTPRVTLTRANIPSYYTKAP